MRKIGALLGMTALLAGLALLGVTGSTVWASSDITRSHTVMIFLFPLAVLFPLVGLIMSSGRRH